MTRRPAGIAALLLLTPLTASCGTDLPHPVDFQLPKMAVAWTTTSFPPGAVTLSIGQRLLVDEAANDTGLSWVLTSPADGRVVIREEDSYRSKCPPETSGCASDQLQVFAGRSPGTITLTWTLRYANCNPTAPPTPGDLSCNHGEQRLQVTVH
jgi:hypothetical protein